MKVVAWRKVKNAAHYFSVEQAEKAIAWLCGYAGPAEIRLVKGHPYPLPCWVIYLPERGMYLQPLREEEED